MSRFTTDVLPFIGVIAAVGLFAVYAELRWPTTGARTWRETMLDRAFTRRPAAVAPAVEVSEPLVEVAEPAVVTAPAVSPVEAEARRRAAAANFFTGARAARGVPAPTSSTTRTPALPPAVAAAQAHAASTWTHLESQFDPNAFADACADEQRMWAFFEDQMRSDGDAD